MDIDLTALPADAVVTMLHFFRGPNPKHSLVLMEGTVDVAFWTEFKVELSILIPAGSKEKLVQVLEKVNQEGELEGIAALIDADCWLVEQSEKLNTRNLLYYDVPDLEVMVLKSPVLEKVLRNSMTFVTLEESREFARKLLNDTWRLGTEYGFFRLVGCRNPRLGLKLRTVSDSIAKHICGKRLELNRRRVAEALLEGSNELDSAELLDTADAIRSEKLPKELCVGGKDLMSVLAHIIPILFKRIFVDDSKYERIDERTLERMQRKLQTDGGGDEVSLVLRNAFDKEYLLHTGVIGRIRNWESQKRESTCEQYKILSAISGKDAAA